MDVAKNVIVMTLWISASAPAGKAGAASFRRQCTLEGVAGGIVGRSIVCDGGVTRGEIDGNGGAATGFLGRSGRGARKRPKKPG